MVSVCGAQALVALSSLGPPAMSKKGGAGKVLIDTTEVAWHALESGGARSRRTLSRGEAGLVMIVFLFFGFQLSETFITFLQNSKILLYDIVLFGN